MSELSDNERAYFRKMFDLYDTDKSGAIGFSELKNLSKHIGVELSDDKLLESLRNIGMTNVTKQNVDLDFHHFIKWLSSSAQQGDEFALLKAKISAKGSKVLNNDQIAKLKEVFDHFDADKSGSIDADELGNVFKAMGQEMTAEELNSLIAGVDDDGSGQIEFNEFMLLMCSNFGGQSFDTDMQNVFQGVDPGTTGKLSLADLKRMIAEVTGGLLTTAEIDEIVSSVDCKDEDGNVEYMKWEALWEACRDM